MEIFKEIGPLRAFLKDLQLSGKASGLVPTMGALHQGHQALVRQSRLQNDVTICSIYVNPTQFNNPTDLLKYPRQLEQDLEMLSATGCDVVFAPTDAEMYPAPAHTSISFGRIANVLEGEFRPGHFNGVGLVVSKLFHLVEPTRAYFGLKDFQQYSIILQMVRELNFPVQVVGVPTLREADGLAMSSRNARLGSAERQAALVLYQALSAARLHLLEGGNWSDARHIAYNLFKHESLSRPEYFEWVDYRQLTPATDLSNSSVLVTAAWIGEVRLIDNVIVRDITEK